LGDGDEGIGESLGAGTAFPVGHWGEQIGSFLEGLLEGPSVDPGETAPYLVEGLVQVGLDRKGPVSERLVFVTAGDALVAGHDPSQAGYIPASRPGYQIGIGTCSDQSGFFPCPVKRDGPIGEFTGQFGLIGQPAGGSGEPSGGFGRQVQTGGRPFGEGCGTRR
jgi:hypothetical protein